MSHSNVGRKKKEEKERACHIVSLKLGIISCLVLLCSIIDDILGLINNYLQDEKYEKVFNSAGIIMGAFVLFSFIVFFSTNKLEKKFPPNLKSMDKIIEAVSFSSCLFFSIEKIILQIKVRDIFFIVVVTVCIILILLITVLTYRKVKSQKEWNYNED